MTERRAKASDPLDTMANAVDRMATGAAGIVATLHDQTELLHDRPTWKQLIAALIAVAVLIVATIGYSTWRLNHESNARGKATREALTHVVVAAIQCLSGGAASDDLYKCTLDVAEGRRKPPPAVEPSATSDTTTTVAPIAAPAPQSALTSIREAQRAESTSTPTTRPAAPQAVTTTTVTRRQITTTTRCGARVGSICVPGVTVPPSAR